MPKLIIGLTGQAGCGKGTAVEILKKEYGADYLRFSAILGDIADRLKLEKSRENLIRLSVVLRKQFGEDILSYAIENAALASPKDVVVIDGIRRLEDIVALEPLDIFKLVAIEVPAEERFKRLKNRGEKSGESNMSWEQFQAEENAETERTIPGVMARAQKTISNAGTPEEFTRQIHEFMTEIGSPLPYARPHHTHTS